MRMSTKSAGRAGRGLLLVVSGGLGLAGAGNGCVTEKLVSPGDPGDPGFTTAVTSPGPPGDDSGFGLNALGIPDGGGCRAAAPAPDFGTPVTCGTPTPPISGGTLLVTHDGSKAVASDPDRDVVYIVDLGSKTRTFTVVLQPGDEPGRLVEDGAGRIHVALRGSGILATIDPTTGTLISRRAACPAPRGVAWKASSDVVLVACATGELASLPAAGGDASVQVIQRDLRDVLVNGDDVAVTLFRSAQVLRLASDGTVSRTDSIAAMSGGFAPQVAWRMVAAPNGTIVAVHQSESTQSVATHISGGYGCGGIGGGPPPPPVPLLLPIPPPSQDDASSVDGASPVDDANPVDDASPTEGGIRNFGSPPPPPPGPPGFSSGPMASVITTIGSDGTTRSTQPFSGVLPVDVAVSTDGSTSAAVAAGAGTGDASIDNLFLFRTTGGVTIQTSFILPQIQPTAVAFEPNGDLVLQSREPAALMIVPGAGVAASSSMVDDSIGNSPTIPLSSVSMRDTGHDIFHTHAGAQIACASCHPEGGDDGHVWLLDGNSRRTPSLRGTIAGTAPYHWPGDEADFASIVKDVYVVRMSGGQLTTDQTTALSSWVNDIPAPPAPTWVNASAATAGRAIFERADVGCATCHYGSKFTNNATVDVGTGGAFQVPPLVGVGWRTPLMHDGCAVTIADRFSICSTSMHGNIAALSQTDVANLTAYLETL